MNEELYKKKIYIDNITVLWSDYEANLLNHENLKTNKYTDISMNSLHKFKSTPYLLWRCTNTIISNQTKQCVI